MSDSPISFRWPKSGSGKKPQRSADIKSDKTLDDNSLMALNELKDVSPNPVESAAYKGTCIHAVNGVELIADADGVAYWPATETLLVADLHLEKGSSFARRGQLIPPYDTITTLRRFEKCLEKWQPRRVIALGDSFHDSEASLRLTDVATEQLRSMQAARDWVWIAGNHDPEPPVGLGGDVAHELCEGGLILRHEPQIDGGPGEISGHLHPKAKLVRRGRHVRRSCFAASQIRMIMPSFGAYTGGLNVFDAAFEGLFDARGFHALMRGDGQVYRISSRHLS